MTGGAGSATKKLLHGGKTGSPSTCKGMTPPSPVRGGLKRVLCPPDKSRPPPNDSSVENAVLFICHAVPRHGIQWCVARQPSQRSPPKAQSIWIPAFARIGLPTRTNIKTPCENLVPSLGGGKRFCRASGQAAGTYKIVRRRASTGR